MLSAAIVFEQQVLRSLTATADLYVKSLADLWPVETWQDRLKDYCRDSQNEGDGKKKKDYLEDRWQRGEMSLFS